MIVRDMDKTKLVAHAHAVRGAMGRQLLAICVLSLRQALAGFSLLVVVV